MSEGVSFYSPAQIERLTGIPMNTLRAWERRYGVPKPGRGPGGHRMYNEGDVQTLLWLQKQLASGVPIGHAIAGMRAHQPEGPSQQPDSLVAEILAATQALDERRLDKVLSDALAIHTVERVCLQVIVPALTAIGEGWARGEISVTAEHFASSQIQAQLYALLRTLPAPPHRPLLYVATPETELHAMSALMLTVLLRRAGWRALYFGANLPVNDLVRILPELRPDYLILSVTMPESLDQVVDVLDLVKDQAGLPEVVMGGQALHGREDLPARLGYHFLGHDMLEAIGQLARLAAVKR
jgi:methanogenic corrinoid protein MtbC1